MGFLLNQIFQFVKLLNSDKGSGQISAGIACGFILGMTPALSIQTFLVLFAIFIFRIQIGAALLSAFFFAFPAYLLDPLFDGIGGAVLEADGLRSLFVMMADAPILPLTRFNNSVVMGSGVTAIALALPIYFVSRLLVEKYREQVVSRFEKTTIWKAVTATGFYKWYLKYDQLKG